MTDPEPAGVPTRGVLRWLDRHAHHDSRTRRYLEFVQMIASVLAVGGLVGLVWQIGQANETARRATYNEAIDTVTNLTKMELDYPGLSCALYPNSDTDYARLSRLDQVATQFLILSTNAQERFWREHRDGLLGEDDWLVQDRWFRNGVVSAAMYPAVWEMNRIYHTPDFVRYVDGVVAQEIAARDAATVAAGGTPSVPTLADFATADGTPTC